MLQKPISTRICHKNNTVCPQAQPYLQLGGHRNAFGRTEKPNILAFLPGILVSKSGLKTNYCVSQICHLSRPFTEFLTSLTRKLMANRANISTLSSCWWHFSSIICYKEEHGSWLELYTTTKSGQKCLHQQWVAEIRRNLLLPLFWRLTLQDYCCRQVMGDNIDLFYSFRKRQFVKLWRRCAMCKLCKLK